MQTINIVKAYGQHSREASICAADREAIIAELPKELHRSADWILARLGTYHTSDHLNCIKEVAKEQPESSSPDAFEFHIMHTVVELLKPTHRDLAYALGMVFHGTWDKVPRPYSTKASREKGYAYLVDCGILVSAGGDDYTMPEIWTNHLWLRGRFVWEDKPYDVTQDYYINIGIYEYELGWMDTKPPRYDEYLKEQAERK